LPIIKHLNEDDASAPCRAHDEVGVIVLTCPNDLSAQQVHHADQVPSAHPRRDIHTYWHWKRARFQSWATYVHL